MRDSGMVSRFTLTLVTLLTGLLVAAPSVLAHGVRIEHTIDPASGAITVRAAYDTGEVLAEAQIVIFAPDDLVNPWRVDTLDADGQFTFMPDYLIEGYWDIQVRQAGHGGLIHIEITADQAAPAARAPLLTTNRTMTPTRWLLSAGVVLGFVGTAFYFARRQQRGQV